METQSIKGWKQRGRYVTRKTNEDKAPFIEKTSGRSRKTAEMRAIYTATLYQRFSMTKMVDSEITPAQLPYHY